MAKYILLLSIVSVLIQQGYSATCYSQSNDTTAVQTNCGSAICFYQNHYSPHRDIDSEVTRGCLNAAKIAEFKTWGVLTEILDTNTRMACHQVMLGDDGSYVKACACNTTDCNLEYGHQSDLDGELRVSCYDDADSANFYGRNCSNGKYLNWCWMYDNNGAISRGCVSPQTADWLERYGQLPKDRYEGKSGRICTTIQSGNGDQFSTACVCNSNWCNSRYYNVDHPPRSCIRSNERGLTGLTDGSGQPVVYEHWDANQNFNVSDHGILCWSRVQWDGHHYWVQRGIVMQENVAHIDKHIEFINFGNYSVASGDVRFSIKDSDFQEEFPYCKKVAWHGEYDESYIKLCLCNGNNCNGQVSSAATVVPTFMMFGIAFMLSY